MPEVTNRGEQYRDDIELHRWRLHTNHKPLTFDDVLDRMAEMHANKGQDYGTEEDAYANVRGIERCGISGWKGAVFKMQDKMSRLETFIRRGSLRNEPVEDSLIDLAVYAVIALVLRSEEAAHGAEAKDQ